MAIRFIHMKIKLVHTLYACFCYTKKKQYYFSIKFIEYGICVSNGMNIFGCQTGKMKCDDKVIKVLNRIFYALFIRNMKCPGLQLFITFLNGELKKKPI